MTQHNHNLARLIIWSCSFFTGSLTKSCPTPEMCRPAWVDKCSAAPHIKCAMSLYMEFVGMRQMQRMRSP